MKRFLVTFAVVANLLLADAVVKELAAGLLKGSAAVSVVPGLFDLAYVENRGCAWGMLQGHVWPLAVFAIAVMGLLIWKRKSVFPRGGWGVLCEILLYAGILGNLVDRIARGCVVDMFDFHWGVYHFPVFNVADSYITVAAALMIALGFFQKDGEQDAERDSGAA